MSHTSLHESVDLLFLAVSHPNLLFIALYGIVNSLLQSSEFIEMAGRLLLIIR